MKVDEILKIFGVLKKMCDVRIISLDVNREWYERMNLTTMTFGAMV